MDLLVRCVDASKSTQEVEEELTRQKIPGELEYIKNSGGLHLIQKGVILFTARKCKTLNSAGTSGRPLWSRKR